MSLFARLKQKVCSHAFAINDLKKTGKDEDSKERVSWPCVKCGKVFLANCGLDISPKHGPTFRKPTTTGEGGE